ncbi:hypothetical protein AAOE16_02740 [Ekhidna sp. MALMAid0563]|uniref:hypothetical protein n=1 Tax=Ekhidna sp. MALMAid0563 TaxID=3143937 RepID=UPI0032DEC439
MKKNILIIILAFTTLFFFAYAFIKADEAEKAAMAAELAQQEALAEKERADVQAELATMRAAEATTAQAEAQRAMEMYMECKDGK